MNISLEYLLDTGLSSSSSTNTDLCISTMADVKEQHQEVTVMVNGDADTAFGKDLDVPYMDDGPSAETPSSSGQLAAVEQTRTNGSGVLEPHCVTEVSDNDSASRPAFLLRILAIFSCCSGDNRSVTVPRAAGNVTLTDLIEEFIEGVRRYVKNIFGREPQEDREDDHRQLFSDWNTFLQLLQGTSGPSAIISSDIRDDIEEFIPWLEERQGEQWTEDGKEWIMAWLLDWNMFLKVRTGETLVTRGSVYLTIVGFVLYIVDLASDIGTSVYYACNGQWWRALVTLAVVYGAVIIHTVIKWYYLEVRYTGAADWLRYVATSLVNWPDVQQYGALCLLEGQLHKSPVRSAHLVPEWHQRRRNVARLKLTEGVWEACPQAILQLCLLLPDLYGAWTWTDYLRIAGASVSLCTAGAALVNWEKSKRITNYTDLPLGELAVLHVWAVPLTVSRLLSVALLLSVHLYWGLAAGALYLVLVYGVHCCWTGRVPRTLTGVIAMCLDTLLYCMSPFAVDNSVTYRRVLHAVHFLGNTAATAVWALGTPLVCVHPALYTAIICCNAVMFAVGLVGWQLHENYWPHTYFSYYND